MGYTQYIGGTAAELGTKTSFEIDRVTRPAQHTVVPIQEQSGASEASASIPERKSPSGPVQEQPSPW